MTSRNHGLANDTRRGQRSRGGSDRHYCFDPVRPQPSTNTSNTGDSLYAFRTDARYDIENTNASPDPCAEVGGADATQEGLNGNIKS